MGTQLALPKRGTTPYFRPMSVVAKRLYRSRCHLVEVGHRPRRHYIRWGSSSPPPKKGHSTLPTFRPMSVVSKRLDGSRCQYASWYEGRRRPRLHSVRWEPSSPRKGHSSSRLFGPCLLWPNGRPSQLLLSTCLRNLSSVLGMRYRSGNFALLGRLFHDWKAFLLDLSVATVCHQYK